VSHLRLLSNATRCLRPVLIALALGVVGGCAKKYDVVPVRGVLTYEGQPVPGMIVRFQPSVGRFSDGLTAEDGTFEMTYTIDTMGVEVDTHEVTVLWSPPTEDGRVKPSRLQRDVLADFQKHGPIKVTIDTPQRNFEIKLPR